MAPKRPPPPPSPPASSTSAEEEDSGNLSPPAKQKPAAKKPKPQTPSVASPQPQPAIPSDQNSSSGNSGSEDDDEDAATGKYTVQPATQKPKSSEQTASDESSSGSEPESEPESPPSKPVTRSGDPTVKPITTKPMTATKDGGKPHPSLSTPSKSAPEPSASDEEPPKKQPFQRIWTEESEVEILKGALDFTREGREPFSEMGAFYDRMRKLLHLSCSKTQLSDKLRRLKKKYENSVKRGKRGKDPEFNKAHDKTAFELSKQIWGPKKKLSNDEDKTAKANGPTKGEATDSKGEAPKASKASRNAKKDKTADSLVEPTRSQDETLSEETRNLILEFCSKEIDMSESLVKQAVDFIEPYKVEELVEKWKEVKIMEMELFAKRSDFSKELMKTILEVLNG